MTARTDDEVVRHRLTSLDATTWGLPMSDAMARRTWADATDALSTPTGPVSGHAPKRVLLICSANVYVAPLPWMIQLRRHGVAVRIKPARGQRAFVHAVAAVLDVEVVEWSGDDATANVHALRDVDGAIAFGSADTLMSIGRRVPSNTCWLPFGPKFGVCISERPDVDDVVLHDTRGCMSPAALFSNTASVDQLAREMQAAETTTPRGALSADEAAAIRARVGLARAVGRVVEGPGFVVTELPIHHVSPVALPRVVSLYRYESIASVRAALAPWAAELGTVASDSPDAPILAAPRQCRPGEMQRPRLSPIHEGIDVLARLWNFRA